MKVAEGVIRDIRRTAFGLLTDENHEKNKEEVWNKTFQPQLDSFQKALQGKKWLLGDRLSYADFQIYDFFSAFSRMYLVPFKNYPDL